MPSGNAMGVPDLPANKIRRMVQRQGLEKPGISFPVGRRARRTFIAKGLWS
jgi:hypothetical protein